MRPMLEHSYISKALFIFPKMWPVATSWHLPCLCAWDCGTRQCFRLCINSELEHASAFFTQTARSGLHLTSSMVFPSFSITPSSIHKQEMKSKYRLTTWDILCHVISCSAQHTCCSGSPLDIIPHSPWPLSSYAAQIQRHVSCYSMYRTHLWWQYISPHRCSVKVSSGIKYLTAEDSCCGSPQGYGGEELFHQVNYQ